MSGDEQEGRINEQASAELEAALEQEGRPNEQASAELEAALEQEGRPNEQASAELEAALEQEAIRTTNPGSSVSGQAGAALPQAQRTQEARRDAARNRRLRIVMLAITMLLAVTALLLTALLKAPQGPAISTVSEAKARIVVNATDSDGRKTTFESTVMLTRQVITGIKTDELRGRGTGPFQEVFVSDQCGFIITWSGQVSVDVVGNLSEATLTAAIGGPVSESGVWPGAECLDGTYYSPNRGATELGYSCSFSNVDFTRNGTYLGPPPEEAPNPYGCKLELELTR